MEIIFYGSIKDTIRFVLKLLTGLIIIYYIDVKYYKEGNLISYILLALYFTFSIIIYKRFTNTYQNFTLEKFIQSKMLRIKLFYIVIQLLIIYSVYLLRIEEFNILGYNLSFIIRVEILLIFSFICIGIDVLEDIDEIKFGKIEIEKSLDKYEF